MTTITKSNSFVAIGSYADDTVVGSNNLISIVGLGTRLTVRGTNNQVTVTGTSQFAPDSQYDVILFQPGALTPYGTVVVDAYNRVAVYGDDITATLVGNDTFSLFGSINTIYANGTNDAVYVGGNGFGATGASVDVVKGLTNGALYEQANSSVFVYGKDYCATLVGDDTLTVSGQGAHVSAYGANNVVNVSGGASGDPDVLNFASGGVVNATNASYVSIFGDHVTLNAKGLYASELIGSADRAVLDKLLNFTVGGNGVAGALDTVTFGQTAFNLFGDAVANVLTNSNVRFNGNGANITANGSDNLVVVGSSDFVNDTGTASRIVIGGNGEFASAAATDSVALKTGDTAVLLANSTIGVENNDAATGSFARVVLTANDFVFARPQIRFFVPITGGNDVISSFDATDRLVLASHYASAADLLAHTSDGLGPVRGAILQLGGGGDTLTFLGQVKSQVADFLASGAIKYS